MPLFCRLRRTSDFLEGMSRIPASLLSVLDASYSYRVYWVSIGLLCVSPRPTLNLRTFHALEFGSSSSSVGFYHLAEHQSADSVK